MRKFLVVILTFILLIFLNILILSIGLKKIIPNNINGSMIKDIVTDNISEELSENFDDNIKDEIVLKLKSSEDIDMLLDDAVNYIINTCLYGNKETLNINTEKLDKLYKELTDIVVNKYLDSKNLPIDNLTDEQLNIIKETLLEGLENDNMLAKEYENAFNKVHDEIYKVTKPYIGVFNRLISVSFKLIIIVGILLIVVISALLLKSWYKWMLSFSIAGLLSGIPYAFVFPLIVNKILDEALKQNNINLNLKLNLTSITTPAYILIGISGALLISYIFISLLKKNNDDFKV